MERPQRSAKPQPLPLQTLLPETAAAPLAVGPSVRLDYEIWHPGLPKSPWFHPEQFVLSVNDDPDGDDSLNEPSFEFRPLR